MEIHSRGPGEFGDRVQQPGVAGGSRAAPQNGRRVYRVRYMGGGVVEKGGYGKCSEKRGDKPKGAIMNSNINIT